MAPLSSLWSFAIGPSYASRPESGSSDLTAATPTTVCHSMEPEAVLGWGRSLFVELGHVLHGLDDVADFAAGVGKRHRSPLTNPLRAAKYHLSTLFNLQYIRLRINIVENFLLLGKVNRQARRPPISIDLVRNERCVPKSTRPRLRPLSAATVLRLSRRPALWRSKELSPRPIGSQSRRQRIVAGDRSVRTSRVLAGSGE